MDSRPIFWKHHLFAMDQMESLTSVSCNIISVWGDIYKTMGVRPTFKHNSTVISMQIVLHILRVCSDQKETERRRPFLGCSVRKIGGKR